MKAISSRSNLAVDNSKTQGGLGRLALFASCLCAILSAACVPPNGTWNSQSGPRQNYQQNSSADSEAEAAAAEREAAAAYDNEHFYGEASGSGHGGRGGSGGGRGGSGYGGNSGGGGGRQWLCKAQATFVGDGPVTGTGAGNSQEEAAQEALNNCLSLYNIETSGAYVYREPKTVNSFCEVVECQ